ncbi:MAG: Disaggr assoc protein [Euryarchaeota archaeon]|nr:Disaggr assoc protein [Euryarchaeota archaeon]
MSTACKPLANFPDPSKHFKIYSVCFLICFISSGTAGASSDQNSINLKLKNDNIVHLQAGNYILTDSIILQSNSILEGEPGTVITIPDHAGWPAWRPLVSGISVHNVTIRNVEIDANSDGNTETSHGKGFYNCIHVIDCDSVNVYNCTFHDGLGDGLRTKTSTNIKFYNNLVYRLGHDGFFGIDSKNIECFNNRITTRTNSALRIWNSQHVRLHDNILDAQLDSLGGNPGIQIEDTKGIVNDIEVCNNILSRTWGAGIWLISYEKGAGNEQDILIHHNLFFETGQSYNIPYTGGIVNDGLKGTQVYNNVFDGARNNAFRNQEGGQGTTIRDNIITDIIPHKAIPQSGTGYGIADLVGADLSVSNNCFFNNQNGGLYRTTSSINDLMDPKTHTSSSGWTWTGLTWTCEKVPPMDLGQIAPAETKNTTDTDTHEFISIFNILSQEFTTTAVYEQIKPLKYGENWQNKGKFTEATLSIEGFKGISEIDGIEYINGSAKDNAIVHYETRNTALLGAGQTSELSYDENNNNLTVLLTVKTSYYVKKSSDIRIKGISISVPRISTESETETFDATSPAPVRFPEIINPSANITYYNNSYNPHTTVYLNNIPGIVKENFQYDSSTATHFKLIGWKTSKANGVEYTNFSSVNTWKFEGEQLSGSGNQLYIKGKFRPGKLNITVTTPYDSIEVTDYTFVEIPDESNSILNPELWAFIGTFSIFAVSIYRNGKRVIPKW